MRRNEQRKRMRLLLAGSVVFVLGSLWGIGAVALRMNPPTEMEKKCLNMTVTESAQCVWEHRKAAGNG